MCTIASHEALKRDIARLHRECTFVGEQRETDYPTLLLFNHGCNSTLALPAMVGALCEFCGREPGIGNNCCAAQWRKVANAAAEQYQFERAAYQAQIDAQADEPSFIDWSVS